MLIIYVYIRTCNTVFKDERNIALCSTATSDTHTPTVDKR